MERELEIAGLSNDGRGVARPADGPVVFVAGALPGERVLARVTASRKGFREAVCTRLIAPAPGAVEPPCPHAGPCGGCPLMRMPYKDQLVWKRRLVTDALSRIAKLPDAPVADIVPSPALYGCRNKIELAFGMEGGRLRLGMRRRSSHAVVATPGCLAVPEAVREAIRATEEACARHACLLPRAGEQPSAPGPLRRARGRHNAGPSEAAGGQARGLRHCILRTGQLPGTTGGAQGGETRIWALLVTGRARAEEREAMADVAREILGRCPAVQAVVHEERGADDLLASGERRAGVYARGGGAEATRMAEVLDGVAYELDCADFFQVNTAAAAHLARLARGHLGAGPLLDLYCGVGAPGLSCVREGDILGIEYSASSVESARRNAAALGVGAEYLAGDAAKLAHRAAQGRRFDQVLCDPPRAGLAPEVTRELLRMAPGRIVAISCNPATLARDVALLSGRYDLASVTPVDLFPHTPHVETVSLLVRRA